MSYKDEEGETLFIMDDEDLKAALWSAKARGTILKIKVCTDNASEAPLPSLTTTNSEPIEAEPVVQEEPMPAPEEPDLMKELKESINMIQKEMGVESGTDSDEEEEKELPDTARTDHKEPEEPKKEYKDFKFSDVFSSVEDAINKSETKVTKKDLIKAVRESVKGTKAEKLVQRVTRRMQGKCGGRQFFKNAMKAWKHQGNKGKCGKKRTADEPDSKDA